ncbi:hypothetical protein JXB27_02775 [Candidatus Woesearchaeota archaeon]|nr:hypothetical protein [Candidatus Woesearchaeota archaeon]
MNRLAFLDGSTIALDKSLKCLEDLLRPEDVFPVKILAEYLNLNGLTPYMGGGVVKDKDRKYDDVDLLALGNFASVTEFAKTYNQTILKLVDEAEKHNTQIGSLRWQLMFPVIKRGTKFNSIFIKEMNRPENAEKVVMNNESCGIITCSYNPRPLLNRGAGYMETEPLYRGNLFIMKPTFLHDVLHIGEPKVQTKIDLSLDCLPEPTEKV